MNRRRFAFLTAAGTIASALVGLIPRGPAAASKQVTSTDVDRSMSAAKRSARLQIAMLVYPEFTAQDLIGPHTFLASLANADVHLVWKNKNAVPLDRGAPGTAIVPTTTFTGCPRDLDLIFVPGGLSGTIKAMNDDSVTDFVADRGSRARYVTSVCTGSLVLGCAGLLKGYKATSHWATRDILSTLGATPVAERVVTDRNRITGAGVTSGIDFGLVLTARLRDATYAQMLQLLNEYDPHPPYQAGNPEEAGPALTHEVESWLAPGIESLKEAAARAQKKRSLS